MFTRRWFISRLGVFLFIAAALRGRAMARFWFRPKEKRPARIPKDPFVSNGASLVGVAKSGTVKEAVREAVSLIGGFERLGLKGKRVLVKPNVVSGEKNPSTTNPEVVEAVVRILYEEGAERVYVGDMSAMLTLSTKRNMKRCGIWDAAKRAGAEPVVFEDYGWVEVELKRAKYIKRAYVTEWMFRVDRIVNLPVIKSHRSASYSICLKNFIGCTHLKQRPYMVDSSHWEELVSEFNLACRPDINIVDGTVSMIEGGPWEGTPAHTGLIIASGDPVAADVIGLGIIKSFGRWAMVANKDVWEQRQIKRALELGIGKGREDIKLVLGKGDKDFLELMEKVKGYTGIKG